MAMRALQYRCETVCLFALSVFILFFIFLP